MCIAAPIQNIALVRQRIDHQCHTPASTPRTLRILMQSEFYHSHLCTCHCYLLLPSEATLPPAIITLVIAHQRMPGLHSNGSQSVCLQFSWDTDAVLNGGKLFAVEPASISCDSNGCVDLSHLLTSVADISVSRSLRAEITKVCQNCDGGPLHVLLEVLHLSSRTVSMIHRVFGQLIAQVCFSLEQRLLRPADVDIPRDMPELDPLESDSDDDMPEIFTDSPSVFHADNPRRTDMELLRYQEAHCIACDRQ